MVSPIIRYGKKQIIPSVLEEENITTFVWSIIDPGEYVLGKSRCHSTITVLEGTAVINGIRYKENQNKIVNKDETIIVEGKGYYVLLMKVDKY